MAAPSRTTSWRSSSSSCPAPSWSASLGGGTSVGRGPTTGPGRYRRVPCRASNSVGGRMSLERVRKNFTRLCDVATAATVHTCLRCPRTTSSAQCNACHAELITPMDPKTCRLSNWWQCNSMRARRASRPAGARGCGIRVLRHSSPVLMRTNLAQW
jgi:hypothetical protein